MTADLAIALIIGVAATIEDLWRRQVSNWISLSALIAGFAWQIYTKGWVGAGSAALGCICGFVVFLLFYLLGGMGGGDVKLMAGFGALLGPGRLLEASLYTAIVGAAIAVLVLAVAALVRLATRGARGTGPQSIPYAPAITAGVWLALVVPR